jgi:hypothetical protein
MVPAVTVAPAMAPAATADAMVACCSRGFGHCSQAVAVAPVAPVALALAMVPAATVAPAMAPRFITASAVTAVLVMVAAMALATEAAAMSFPPTAAMELLATARLATEAP